MKEYIIRVKDDGSYRVYNSYMGRQTTEILIPPFSVLKASLTGVIRLLDQLETTKSVDYDYDAEEVKEDKNGNES